MSIVKGYISGASYRVDIVSTSRWGKIQCANLRLELLRVNHSICMGSFNSYRPKKSMVLDTVINLLHGDMLFNWLTAEDMKALAKTLLIENGYPQLTTVDR